MPASAVGNTDDDSKTSTTTEYGSFPSKRKPFLRPTCSGSSSSGLYDNEFGVAGFRISIEPKDYLDATMHRCHYARKLDDSASDQAPQHDLSRYHMGPGGETRLLKDNE